MLANHHVRDVFKMDYSVNIYPPDGADVGNHDLRLHINAIRKPMSTSVLRNILHSSLLN